MMRRASLPTFISILAVAPALSQSQPSAPRAIPLPDTLGASFAAADTLTGRSGPADYARPISVFRHRAGQISVARGCYIRPRPDLGERLLDDGGASDLASTA